MSGKMHTDKVFRIALVGMSGSGKTFWSRKLAAAGWKAVSCDDLIEKRLAPRLAAGGYAGIHGVAAWMGWPDSPTYAEREAEYLAEEIAVVDEYLTRPGKRRRATRNGAGHHRQRDLRAEQYIDAAAAADDGRAPGQH